jgi:hypothetical protein
LNISRKPKPIQAPSLQRKLEIYSFYQLIWRTDFELVKKRKLLASSFDCEPWGSRVTKISENALREIAGNDFNHPPGKLCRNHSVPQNATHNMMLEIQKPMIFKEWWKLFWKNDKSILMTTAEHKLVGQKRGDEIGNLYNLDWKKGYFANDILASWKHRKTIEGVFVRNICEENKIVY